MNSRLRSANATDVNLGGE
jgi:hypothetical protein